MSTANRRAFLQRSALAAAGLIVAPMAEAGIGQPDDNGRILVVVELSGGNDGLNSVVPYGDDAYYRHRPSIGIRRENLLRIDEHYGFNPGMLGFERLWNRGELAIVHGCGYDNPSFSHFTAMNYWHTGAPNSGEKYGWLGRLADASTAPGANNALINIGSSQSLAVNSAFHRPLVFDDPERFARAGFSQQQQALASDDQSSYPANPSRQFLRQVARSALHSSLQIRQAWSDYNSPIDYGIAALDLPKVAACIAAGLPTRLYHVAFRNNAFDTHVQQPALHRRLLSYACDGIHGFIRDLERLGLADKVSVLVHSEFGRRVPENANQGTDHGSANVMFFAGKNVRGGHYGRAPNLTDLTDGDNLKHTTDFRRVYATAIDGWLDRGAASEVLKGDFPPLPIFS